MQVSDPKDDRKGFLNAFAWRHRKYVISDLLCVRWCAGGPWGASWVQGGVGGALAVIRQPASPHWQAWGLGSSNLGRSFGERRIASSHRGAWGVCWRVLAESSIAAGTATPPLGLQLDGRRRDRPEQGRRVVVRRVCTGPERGCRERGGLRAGMCCSVGAVGHLCTIFNSVSKSEAELNMVFVIRCGAGGSGNGVQAVGWGLRQVRVHWR